MMQSSNTINLSFIGDVHGHFELYKRLLTKLDEEKRISIQLGDMGLGFVGHDDSDFPNPTNHFFIRGNHDNPKACSKYHGYLGDYGFDSQFGLFYVSGAASIDKHLRTIGIDWWEDEELNQHQCKIAISLYERIKPDIIISHDGPDSLMDKLYHNYRFRSRTTTMLDMMFKIHQPSRWILAHHHASIEVNIDKTMFIILDELERYDL